MSYYPPPVTPGVQSTATTSTTSTTPTAATTTTATTATATTATYPYGGYQPYYYQWPPYSYAVPQTAARPATTTVQSAVSMPTASTPRPATYTPYTSYTREGTSNNTTTAGRGSKKQSSTKGLFTKELRNLMYGFGDDRNPANDTVNVMEEILVEYIADVCQAAAGPRGKGRLSIEDLRKTLSRPADAKKLARMEELLFAQEDIKRARSQFDTDPKMA